MSHETNAAIGAVLPRWGFVSSGVAVSPVAKPGLSGIGVFRVADGRNDLALRQWNPSAPLATIHKLMQHASEAGLSFVPRLIATPSGETLVRHGRGIWSLETWMPGEPADVPAFNSRVVTACATLARFHLATVDLCLDGKQPAVAPSPALARRQSVLSNLPTPARGATALSRIARSLPRAALHAEQLVSDVVGRATSLQPIHGDARREHFLFMGDQVAGLIDYGAATIDTPMVDLARLLGDLAGNDAGLWRTGIAAYRLRRSVVDRELALLPALDAGGVAGAAANWLRWLEEGTVAIEDSAVAERLTWVASRLEPLSAGNLIAARALTS